jgi:hypothetical protein
LKMEIKDNVGKDTYIIILTIILAFVYAFYR